MNAPRPHLSVQLQYIARRLLNRDASERAAALEFEADQAAGRQMRRAQSIHDHYDEAADLRQWEKSKASFHGGGRRGIPVRLTLTRDLIIRLIANDPSIRSVVDFGCHYAWAGAEIAKRFPHISVIATDRHETMQAHNRADFSLPNLDLPAVPDIAAFIRAEPQRLRDGIFVTTYTMMFLLPAAVRDIYAAARDAGARYIIAHERTGMSFHKLRQYQFSHQAKPSWWHYHGAVMHNYPEIIQAAGFDLIQASCHLLPQAGQNLGNYSVIFVGKR